MYSLRHESVSFTLNWQVIFIFTTIPLSDSGPVGVFYRSSLKICTLTFLL